MKKTIFGLFAAAMFSLPSQAAILVSLGAPGDYPASGATLNTTTQPQSTEFYDTLGNPAAAELQLAQTFQLSSSITLDSLTISADDILGGVTVDIGIYAVGNTNSPTLTFAGSNLLATTSFTFAGSSRSGPSSITFDFTGSDEIFLAASTGTEGYALAFSVGSTISGGYFDWGRTSGTGSGPVYPDGVGYDDGGAVSGDFGISIVAVPEPTSAALLIGGLSLLAFRRRRA